MKYFVKVSLVSLFLLSGCASKSVDSIVNKCDISYDKCIAECKLSNIGESEWKKAACKAKCKSFYLGCKAKENTQKGVNYIKEKIAN